MTTSSIRNKYPLDIDTVIFAIKNKFIQDNPIYYRSFINLCCEHLMFNLHTAITETKAQKLLLNKIIEHCFYEIPTNLAKSYFYNQQIYEDYIALLNLLPKEIIEKNSIINVGVPLSDNQLENIEYILSSKLLLSRFRDREYFKYIANNINLVEDFEHKIYLPDFVFIHGSGSWSPQPETVQYATDNNIPLIRMEDGFLRSADTWCNHKVHKKYTTGISFTFTNDVFYFDATKSSFMERQINNPNFKLTKEQIKRARDCIKKIVDNHLTKYNHQPIFTPNIGRNGVKKILVVDQSYGDFSIQKGLANDDTFKEMLASAIRENPDADIIVKTHPDAIAPGTKRPLGYYSTLEDHDNIYVIREPINPIALLKYVDKVYVCTTQFGFEALMCGKEVHTFGMPFYAGWGLTIDAQKCSRRTAKRTLEEIFYIAYIKNTLYVDPVNKQRCSLDRAIDYLIELRDEYDAYKKGEIDINSIKVSLIIPVYNVEKYLKECLNSAINQTLKEIEIICVDDGSTDGSKKILKEYAKKDSRIKIINQKNQKQGAARNNAMKIAKGEYLVFLDSDDYLRDDALELIYSKMKKNNLDMLSYSGYNFKDGSNEKEINPYWQYSYIPENFNLDRFNYKDCLKFMHQLNVSTCTTAYRRWFVESNNIYFPENLFFEDNVFFIKAITSASSCGILMEKIYNRRIHQGQTTQNWDKHYKDYLKISDIVLKYMKNFKYDLYQSYLNSYLMRCIWIFNSFTDKQKKEYNIDLQTLLDEYNFKSDKIKRAKENVIKTKPSLLKSYLFLPYYLLKIQQMRRKLGKSKPSRLFSINKYENKKVYRILGFKFAFNNFKKDVIDNQEKILKMLNDLTMRQKKLEQECKELRSQLNAKK